MECDFPQPLPPTPYTRGSQDTGCRGLPGGLALAPYVFKEGMGGTGEGCRPPWRRGNSFGSSLGGLWGV